MKARATYESGEIEVIVTANVFWSDDYIECVLKDIEIESLTVFGVKLLHNSLVLSALCEALIEDIEKNSSKIQFKDEILI